MRRNPWIMGLAVAPLALAFVGLIAGIAGFAPGLIVLPHLLILGTVFPLLAWRKNSRHREQPGKIVADERGVSHAGELIAPRERIRDAVVLPRFDGPPMVRIRQRGRIPVELRVGDHDEARALLRALGHDASQSVATFRLPSMAFSDAVKRRRNGFIWAVAAVGFGLFMATAGHNMPHLRPLMPVLMCLIAFASMIYVMVPTKLQVGADGLLIKWFRTTRFIGYGDIARIAEYEDGGRGKGQYRGIALALKSGEVLRLPVVAKRSSIRDSLQILHQRIAEAVQTWSRGEGVAHAALVRRGERDPLPWVRALRGIGAQANADNRTAPVLPERLWRIVEDPAAPADARAGAAVALSETADDESRARLRAAAAAIAAPKLRFAIEAAARNDTEEALAGALAEMDAEAAAEPKRFA
ncbi:MAG: hypothetical protein R3B70_04400 [Polyangiaceae bacterium]